MTIRISDLGANYTEFKAKIDTMIAEELGSGWYIRDPQLTAFKASLVNYCEAEYCVGVANGLDPQVLKLHVLGVAAGDEVIVPSDTYVATWFAVSAVNTTPMPVEADPSTHDIGVTRIAPMTKTRTKALLPVHSYAQSANPDPILRTRRRRAPARYVRQCWRPTASHRNNPRDRPRV